MIALAPCPHCRRHVRDVDDTCPFCGGAATAVPKAIKARGRLTRAAIFAAALGTAGCGSSQPDTAEPKVTQNDAGPTAAEQELDADIDAEAAKELERQQIENMPYGAPPARRRLV